MNFLPQLPTQQPLLGLCNLPGKEGTSSSVSAWFLFVLLPRWVLTLFSLDRICRSGEKPRPLAVLFGGCWGLLTNSENIPHLAWGFYLIIHGFWDCHCSAMQDTSIQSLSLYVHTQNIYVHIYTRGSGCHVTSLHFLNFINYNFV